ncbi:polyprenyl synthetase family protein [Rothia kristinae]|uniref:polyprenyl synthetase family protein n=1 Tax=Rothia kristinae TaxID=37923 RepID=UPI0011AB1929
MSVDTVTAATPGHTEPDQTLPGEGADAAGREEFPGFEGIALPAGFELIAQDEALGPDVLQGLADVETRLGEALRYTDALADTAARHLLEAGGKRVRPLLTLLAARAAGAAEITGDVLDAAVVTELTHLATLYHDDVMDEAATRRGTDAAHRIWGNSVAILTGDLIFSRASLIVSELGARPLAIQAKTFERLVLGQLHETSGPGADEDRLAHYIKVIEGKTGSLIAAACEYGSTLAGAPEQTVQVLVRYGELVGVAFQLADDVIDVTADAETSGKTPGTDLREGVATLPSILLRQAAADGDAEAARVVELIDGDLTEDAALAEAVAALSAHPVTQEAWRIAYRWADDAIEALAPLPESTVKEALKSFAHAVVHRQA